MLRKQKKTSYGLRLVYKNAWPYEPQVVGKIDKLPTSSDSFGVVSIGASVLSKKFLGAFVLCCKGGRLFSHPISKLLDGTLCFVVDGCP